MKKNIVMLVLALISAFGLVGCGAQDAVTSDTDQTDAVANSGVSAEASGESGEPLQINLGTTASTASAIIADQKGFFEEELAPWHATVVVNLFKSGLAVTQAEASGDIDLGVGIGEQPALVSVAEGYDVKVISLDTYSTEFNQLFVLSDSGIEAAQDLKGKVVGTSIGTSMQYQLDCTLAYGGLTAEDVEIVNTSDFAVLLLSGEIDAATCTISSVQTYVDDGSVIGICDGEETGYITTGWINGANSFLEAHPDETVAFLRAIAKADAWIEENEEEAVQIIVDYTQNDESVVRSTLEYLHRETGINENVINAAAEVLQFLKDNDLVEDKSIEITDIYVDDYWQAAAQ